MLSTFSNIMWLIPLSIFTLAPDFSPVNDNPKGKKNVRWAVQKTSSISIQGSTNVNSFGCDIIGYYKPDTIYCSEASAVTKSVTLNGDLRIDVSKFDCHNKMLTGDLRKTLKADAYPTMVIRFLNLERAPIIHNNKDSLKGWVEIELAGTRRRFEVFYTFVKTGATSIQLNGKRCFSFGDFSLVPPKKFAGLIKVKDRFDVDFNLLLDPVE